MTIFTRTTPATPEQTIETAEWSKEDLKALLFAKIREFGLEPDECKFEIDSKFEYDGVNYKINTNLTKVVVTLKEEVEENDKN